MQDPNRRLSAAGDGATALGTRRLAAPQMHAPATTNARPCMGGEVRQHHRSMLTEHPAPATVLPQANLDAQGGLHFLSVGDGHDAETHSRRLVACCGSPQPFVQSE